MDHADRQRDQRRHAPTQTLELSYVDPRVAAEKQNGVGTPYIPPMTRRSKCRIDPEQSPYTCMLPEHKPMRRGAR
jgi:hypothetical protein